VCWYRGKESALALFVPGVFADNAHDVVAADDPAGLAETFDGSSDFHDAKREATGGPSACLDVGCVFG
jgi:hypothetical protein